VSPVTSPPGVIPLVGAVSLAVAVATIALCTWSVTRAHFTAPPGRSSTRVTLGPQPASAAKREHRPPRRVTVAEGDAILNGIAQVIPLTQPQRSLLTRMLVDAEDKIAIETPPEPTAASVAAALTESGALFGEEGSYAIIGDVRVEVTPDRVKLAGAYNGWPSMEAGKHGSTVKPGGTWSFAPVPPPATQPAAAAAAPPAPPTLREQLSDLAPRLPYYADAAASALLAILLIVSSVGLLRFSRLGRTLHLTWAWVKLPLALGAAGGYFWLVMGGSLRLPTGLTPWTQFVLKYPEFVASLLAALYALATIIVLMLPPVRRYYRRGPLPVP
jgi:hypothetical protein